MQVKESEDKPPSSKPVKQVQLETSPPTYVLISLLHPLHTDSNHIFFWWTSLLSFIFIDPVEQILGSFRKTKFFLNQTIIFTVIYSQDICTKRNLSLKTIVLYKIFKTL